MPLFTYAGLNDKGSRVNGTIEASGRKNALSRLREQRIYATSVVEQSADKTSLMRLRKRRVTASDLALLTRQLATLIGAGLPLDEALAATAEQQEKQSLQLSLETVREQVQQGVALHEALAAEKHFPELCVSMVAVGEASGSLDRIMEQLADYFDDASRVSQRIRSALTYPILMGVIGSAVLFFLVTFVLPNVTRMLDTLDRELPLATRILIGSSDLLADWWWLLLLLLAAGLFFLQRYLQTSAGAFKKDTLLLKLPIAGNLYRSIATARFARTLGSLLQAGVALPRALEIASSLLGNRRLRLVVDDAIVAVREGSNLAEPLINSGLFPPLLTRLIAAGEQSGQLENMLLRAAVTCEQQSEMAISGLLSLLEPIMIVVMGVAVGYIVLAILLPIFDATSGF
jgi:general secretion pathway protein F